MASHNRCNDENIDHNRLNENAFPAAHPGKLHNGQRKSTHSMALRARNALGDISNSLRSVLQLPKGHKDRILSDDTLNAAANDLEQPTVAQNASKRRKPIPTAASDFHRSSVASADCVIPAVTVPAYVDRAALHSSLASLSVNDPSSNASDYSSSSRSSHDSGSSSSSSSFGGSDCSSESSSSGTYGSANSSLQLQQSQEQSVINIADSFDSEATDRSVGERSSIQEIDMEDALNLVDSAMDISFSREPLTLLDQIDRSLDSDVFLASNYSSAIFRHLKQCENNDPVNPNYMQQQRSVTEKARAILINWLIEVHYKISLKPETLFLCVNIIDRFLSKASITKKHLQLLGCTALFLACKYEEMRVPLIEDFVYVADNAFDSSEMLEMEMHVINLLQFRFTVATPYPFLERFCIVACAQLLPQPDEAATAHLCLTDASSIASTHHSSPADDGGTVPNAAEESQSYAGRSFAPHPHRMKPQNRLKLRNTAFYVCERMLLEYQMIKYPPSILAAATVSVALHINELPVWCTALEQASGYRLSELDMCIAEINQYLRGNILHPQTLAVKKKYASRHLLMVSRNPLPQLTE